MKYVVYDEPDENGENRTIKISTKEAIRRAKESALRHNYVYADEEKALCDFLVVHWGWIVFEKAE